MKTFECLYCGHKFISVLRQFLWQSKEPEEECPVCSDKNTKKIADTEEKKNTDVYGYDYQDKPRRLR